MELSFEQVENYLDRHRDFFKNRETLLARMELNYQHGPAISLAERQIRTLREQNSSIIRQIEELVTNAKRHDQMMTHIHHFLLEMVQLQELGQMIGWIKNGFVEKFGADCVDVTLDSGASATPDLPLLRTLGIGDRAVCVDLEHIDYLNAMLGLSEPMRSYAVLPLSSLQPFGYILLGSRQSDRYQPDLGTLYLQMLADCCSSVLSPLLAQMEDG